MVQEIAMSHLVSDQANIKKVQQEDVFQSLLEFMHQRLAMIKEASQSSAQKSQDPLDWLYLVGEVERKIAVIMQDRESDNLSREINIPLEGPAIEPYEHPLFTYHIDRSLLVGKLSSTQERLTPIEGRIMNTLVGSPNQVIVRNRLVEALFKTQELDSSALKKIDVKTHMSRIRTHLRAVGIKEPGKLIETIPTLGYVLHDPTKGQVNSLRR